MHEIDFLAVENVESESTKSGDAIAMTFTTPAPSGDAVVVIDGGFTAIGDSLVDHIEEHYGTTKIDLVISTHPDTDHINGLIAVLERCEVGELMMHLPWLHNSDAGELGNYERIVQLYDLAVAKGVTITEPFTGIARFGGALRILGPTESFYEGELASALAESPGASLSASGFGSTLLAKATKVLERALAYFPVETLSDSDETSARNKMSVITLVQADAQRYLFTGDAGIPSLEAAADEYERVVGSFASNPLDLFQVPHHGSHRNVGPSILDRIIGTKSAPFSTSLWAVISSANLSEKHPSPKVTNALGRRSARVAATEGQTVSFMTGSRAGWGPVTPIGPLEEEDL